VATPVCNHFKSKEETFAGSLSARGILAIFEYAPRSAVFAIINTGCSHEELTI